MIFRKPYAFLIKNFRKIHIVLLACSVYILFKINDLIAFIKDFIYFGTYNAYLDSFDAKVGVLYYIATLFIIFTCLSLIILLQRKKKPWKIYLVYIGVFGLLFGGVAGASSFFSAFKDYSNVSGILGIRDILNIGHLFIYPIMFLLIIRILGFDLKKFGFEKDQEFLELSEDDRDEFEVNFEFDRRSFIRVWNRFLRNANYFYLEHKFVCNIFIVCFTIFILGYSCYNVFVIHRSYREGNSFNSGIYTITPLASYVSDKDFSGNVIEEGYKFVVVSINIKNNYYKQIAPNFSRFHLVNGNMERTYSTYYNSYFTDYGLMVDNNLNIPSGSNKTVNLVYKIKNSYPNNRFVLYYQELDRLHILRKIKINVKDSALITSAGEYPLNKKVTFIFTDNSKKEVTLRSAEINDNFNFKRYYCISSSDCSIRDFNLSNNGQKILKITFSGSDFDGEDFIDFLVHYGKIRYRVDNSKNYSVMKYFKLSNALSLSNEGKEVFIKLNDAVSNSDKIDIICTLRNRKYILNVK